VFSLPGEFPNCLFLFLFLFLIPCSLFPVPIPVPIPVPYSLFPISCFSRPNSCDPENAMKILLGILAVLLVAASLFADYKWRQWMAVRRRNRQ
jgi:hypothetical protein